MLVRNVVAVTGAIDDHHRRPRLIMTSSACAAASLSCSTRSVSLKPATSSRCTQTPMTCCRDSRTRALGRELTLASGDLKDGS
jgi:hypothetical protein